MSLKPEPNLERLLQHAHLMGIDVSVHAKAIERRVLAAEAKLSKALAAQA